MEGILAFLQQDIGLRIRHQGKKEWGEMGLRSSLNGRLSTAGNTRDALLGLLSFMLLVTTPTPNLIVRPAAC